MDVKNTISRSAKQPVGWFPLHSPKAPYIPRLAFNFALSTWLLLGGCVQTLVLLATQGTHISLWLPFVLLLVLLLSRLFISIWQSNRESEDRLWKEDLARQRDTVVLKRSDVLEDEGVSQQKVAVMLIGAKSYRPSAAPDYLRMAKFFREMKTQLNEAGEFYGYLGGTHFTRKDEYGCLESFHITYWRSIENLHDYARGPLHVEAWKWWDTTMKENDSVGLYHEIFEAIPGHFEAIYLNCPPSGLGSTAYLRGRWKH